MCPQQIQVLSGRNADGSYKTAVGKEYPGLLCKVIVTSVGDVAFKAEHIAVPPAVDSHLPWTFTVCSSLSLFRFQILLRISVRMLLMEVSCRSCSSRNIDLCFALFFGLFACFDIVGLDSDSRCTRHFFLPTWWVRFGFKCLTCLFTLLA